MIKTKHKLDIEIIKPLPKVKCPDCIYKKGDMCRLFGDTIYIDTINLCNKISEKSLDCIHSNIKTNRKKCNLLCYYYDTHYCDLFNLVLNSHERCQQCIDLFKGSYI